VTVTSSAKKLPLGVDLDGTLIRTDMLHETTLLLVKQRPWLLFALPFWLLGGKASLKQKIASRVRIDVGSIPLNDELHLYLQSEKAGNRKLGLFSASDQTIVRQMAERIGLFDVAMGSDGQTNLSGANKLTAIVASLGEEFVYAGNSSADFAVWRGARAAIVVGDADKLRPHVERLTQIEREFQVVRPGVAVWLKALRVHQWLKNGLLFVPLILAAPTVSVGVLPLFLIGFLVLSLLSSSTYLLNDLLDLEADRNHRSKKLRPLASGAISLHHGVLAGMGLLALAIAGLMTLPPVFAQVAAVYVVTTITYTFAIKRMMVLDALCLGFLFTLRIYAGALLMGGPAPYWLLAFSMFIFISLAFVKRHTEINAAKEAGSVQVAGRDYLVADLPMVQLMGMACAIGAVVVFLIYLGDQHFNAHVFSKPHWLALSCGAIGYWLLRIWMLTSRNQMHDDPIVFALKDRGSLGIVAVVMLSLALAW